MPPSTEHIWEHLSRDLAGFIRRRVRDEAAADDVLQDTFVRIHRGIETLRDEERLVPWVYQVARSAIADHGRRAGPPRARADRAPDDDPIDDEPSPPDNYNPDVTRWLSRMIGDLPPPYRAAMELVEREGLTQREIAARLGLSLPGAKSRVQRGRRLLAGMLLECCHIELDRFGNVVDVERRGTCSRCCDDGACA